MSDLHDDAPPVSGCLARKSDLRAKAQTGRVFPVIWKDAAPWAGSWQGGIVAAMQRISRPVPGKIRPNPPFTGQ
jgi:hypothetical protein